MTDRIEPTSAGETDWAQRTGTSDRGCAGIVAAVMHAYEEEVTAQLGSRPTLNERRVVLMQTLDASLSKIVPIVPVRIVGTWSKRARQGCVRRVGRFAHPSATGEVDLVSTEVSKAQAPLRVRYRSDPTAAMVTDHALAGGSSAVDPFHSIVRPMPASGEEVPVGVHRAIGGPHDAPTPGDILCSALAACQDSAVRMVANALGIELEHLEVEVTGQVDVRGTMMIDRDVPVGFQNMTCQIRLRAKKDTPPRLLEKLQVVARRICVVQETLRNPPEVRTMFDIAHDPEQR